MQTPGDSEFTAREYFLSPGTKAAAQYIPGLLKEPCQI
jgi:hypothetical protein